MLNSLDEKIRNQFASHLAENDIELVQFECVRVISRPFSRVTMYDAHTSKGICRIVAKKIVHHSVNLSVTTSRNQAVVEFEILRKLHPQFQAIVGCAVPRPILVMPDEEVFVMEFAEGQCLSELLGGAHYFANAARFKLLQCSYQRIGRWLRCFHEFTGVQFEGKECLDPLLERCEFRLGLIRERHHPAWTPDLHEKILQRMRQKVSAVGFGTVPVAGRHGDFGDWNILANSEGIIVLDFMGFSREPLVLDVLKIIVNLESLELHVAYSASRIEKLRSLLLGELGVMTSMPTEVVEVCEMYHRICLIHGCLNNPEQGLVRRVWKRKLLKANIDWLVRLVGGGRYCRQLAPV